MEATQADKPTSEHFHTAIGRRQGNSILLMLAIQTSLVFWPRIKDTGTINQNFVYRYHQPEFRQGRRRINDDNEYFNRAHSSLRSCIERTIGVFKSRFPVVYCMPWYSIRTQVQIILSAMAFHNFIRRDRDPEEDMFHVVETPEEYTFEDLPDRNPPNLEDLEDTPDFGVGNEENDPVMNDIRNNIKAELPNSEWEFAQQWFTSIRTRYGGSVGKPSYPRGSNELLDFNKFNPTKSEDYIHPYLDRRDFYAPFKGKCIGALDGTHVKLQFRRKGDGLVFRGRKGYPTINILAVCDFNLTFVYVSCGWDGISHDHHIFKQTTKDPIYKFPHPQQGKFYLVDAGYPNAIGYLAPYKGHRYHQEEFRRGLCPINDEIFAKAMNPTKYTLEDLEDEDPEQLDREDDLESGEGVPNDEHDADIDDVRNNIRAQLQRLRKGRGMRRR
ncbi:hypothetical protein Vadar_022235 [Vaccinium darrowii]|uniref:Uncharacterized protein n=1 Tax=Vaccinium darrowii TaxID=229202 RepID=A0ACB7X300_9ERIC|nr:hypothetical protein Vadar_022235 [Vaccinium darrowii]